MYTITKKIAPHILILLLSVILFLSFGLFHLTKFETTDEHFWKEDRIEKYYNGIKQGVRENIWKKTRINDKPGVSVALVSGMGLPFSPKLKAHRDNTAEQAASFFDERKQKTRKLFTIYHTEQTHRINLALRLPILLLNTLLLIYFFWVLSRAYTNKWIASLTVLLIALNPILIGMSQIINPDSLLWSFSVAAIFSYLALLKTREKKFIILTGLFAGLSILSKYTGNILLIFFVLITYSHLIFDNVFHVQKFLKKQWKDLALITAVAWTLFALLMPAVIQQPIHFLDGTLLSPVFKPAIIPLLLLCGVLIFDAYVARAKMTSSIMGFLAKHQKALFRILAAPILFIILFSLANAWSGAPFFMLDDLKEVSREGGDMVFPQFAQDHQFIRATKIIAVQSQNIIFSLHPTVIFILLCTLIFLCIGRFSMKHRSILFFILISFLFFVLGGWFANIFVNVRYAIILYPLLALLSALILSDAFSHHTFFKKSTHAQYFPLLIVSMIVLAHCMSLLSIKPHYFNYESVLLPKKYVVTDAWGYGVYEAAAYLNTLPHARELVVWSDRAGICQFFVGRCIRSGKIELDHTTPDYFVFTRRGMIRKQFSTTGGPEGHDLTKSHYYSDEVLNNPAWELHIGGRQKNFVKVIKVEK